MKNIQENYDTGPWVLIDTENEEVWGIIRKAKDAYRIDHALDDYEMRGRVSLLDITEVKKSLLKDVFELDSSDVTDIIRDMRYGNEDED